MSQPPAFGINEDSLLFGKIAVENGLITSDQLSDALMAQMQNPAVAIGQILIQAGVMTQHTVAWVLQKQQSESQAGGGGGVAAPVVPTQAPALQEAPGLASLAMASQAQSVPAPTAAEPAVPAQAVPPSGPAQAAVAVPSASDLEGLVRFALSKGASDLHLHSGTSVKIRIHGDLAPIDGLECTKESVTQVLDGILSPVQKQTLADLGQIDFAHSVPDVARMRCNAYRQQRGTDVAFRLVAPRPPTLEELNLPDTLAKLSSYHQGMVLFTGPTGCGKTSTLAALLNLVNEGKPDHILTVEDPIEYIHPSKQCIVNQRQVQGHTESFARALRGALREDPDVIVIGELRDLETVSLALTAAETGHLVLATMHTMNSIATINRLIGAFPPDEQAQIRTMVSESLRAIVSQRMVKKADGTGRVPALEILIANTAIANLIRDQKTFQIPSILQTGGSKGMCLLDASLLALVKEGTITKEEALLNCDNPKGFG